MSESSQLVYHVYDQESDPEDAVNDTGPVSLESEEPHTEELLEEIDV